MKKKKKGVISFNKYDESKQDNDNIVQPDVVENIESEQGQEQDADINLTADTQESAEQSNKKSASRSVRRAFMKSKKYGRLIMRLSIILIAVILMVVIYVNRDNLSAQGIYDWAIELVTGQGRGDGYPITAPGSRLLDMDMAGNDIAVLTDSSVVSYDKYGKRTISTHHKMGNPTLRTTDNALLLYDRGGSALSVSRKSGTSELETKYKLLTADIGGNGVYAMATRSEDGYMSEMHVYNKRDKEIYKAYQSKYLITDISVSGDGKNVATLTLGAMDGGYYSGIKLYDLSSDEPTQIDVTEALIIDIQWAGDNIIAVGTDKAFVFDRSGNEIDQYIYGGKLISYCFDGDYSCMLLNDDVSGEYIAAIIDKTGELICESEIPNGVKRIYMSDKILYALTSSELYSFDLNGELLNEWLTQGDSDKVAAFKDHAYVAGGMTIHSINTK